MKKRSIIELTPLLDVILLLIFAFLINMQVQSDDMNEKFDSQQDEIASLEAYIDAIEEDYTNLIKENSNLKQENSELSEKADKLTEQLGYETVSNEAEKETVERVVEAFNEITGISNEELSEILSQEPSAKSTLSRMVDSDDMVLELYKYSYVMNRFFFIDLELMGEENRVYINGEQTQIAITREDSTDDKTKEEKSLKIYDELKELIDNRPGGDEMVMVTLIVRDPEVYQYAYEIAWESLRELELRASGYRLYKTSYTYTE